MNAAQLVSTRLGVPRARNEVSTRGRSLDVAEGGSPTSARAQWPTFTWQKTNVTAASLPSSGKIALYDGKLVFRTGMVVGRLSLS